MRACASHGALLNRTSHHPRRGTYDAEDAFMHWGYYRAYGLEEERRIPRTTLQPRYMKTCVHRSFLVISILDQFRRAAFKNVVRAYSLYLEAHPWARSYALRVTSCPPVFVPRTRGESALAV